MKVTVGGRPHYLKIKPIQWDKPSCSKLQTECKQLLKGFWQGDNVGEEVKLPGTRLEFDFVNVTKRTIIEIQGRQHAKYVKHFHKNVFGFMGSMKRDEKKAKFAEENGLTLLCANNANELRMALTGVFP